MSYKGVFFKKRHDKEARFKLYGLLSILLSLSLLGCLLVGVLIVGSKAFVKAELKATLFLDSKKTPQQMLTLAFQGEETRLLSPVADFKIHDFIQKYPEALGTTVTLWLPLYDGVDQYLKGSHYLKAYKRSILQPWKQEGKVALNYNWNFFSSSDSREPEIAGIWGAIVGTLYTLLVTFLIAFPLGIGTAIYLEEFAKKNKWTRFIEVNINNLASVPSIIFGLLGLAIYINLFGLPALLL